MRSQSEPLDVLLATLRFYPVYSGPGERFRRYAPGLRERGVKLRVFSVAWKEEESEDGASLTATEIGEFAPTVEVDGISIDRVVLSRAMPRWKMLRTYFASLARYVSRGSHLPDVVQLLNLSYWGIPFLLRMRRMKIPVVHTATMVRDPSIGYLRNILYALPFRFLDRTVVSTGVMRDSLRAVGVNGPTEIIPNGVDVERFRPAVGPEEVKETREKLGLPKGGPLITFVGGYLHPRKGVDLLAEAWSEIAVKHPDARLILVGPRHDDLRPTGPQKDFLAEVDQSLERSGARDRVIFTGKVNNVEEYLRVSDIFVFPSRREGMPNVVPEAFGCGVATVLTPFVGLPDEFGTPGNQYILVEDDPRSLARAVVDLLRRPDRRLELGRCGREWVENHLALGRSLDEYSRLYRSLASSSPRGTVRDEVS